MMVLHEKPEGHQRYYNSSQGGHECLQQLLCQVNLFDPLVGYDEMLYFVKSILKRWL